MSEVLNAFDAIATGLSEYHAVLAYFPSLSYGANNLAYFSEGYATIDLNDLSDRNYNISIVANFTSNLNLESITASDYGKLTMVVTYDTTEGYLKTWALTSPDTTIDALFVPKR